MRRFLSDRSLFSSDRERRLWAWTLAVVVAIYSTLGLTATLAGALRDSGLVEEAALFSMFQLPDGRLLYELRHRWRDGTTHVAFEPLELIDRLAALVPPPRFHTVRYHGVLASRSKHRASVVPARDDNPSPAEDNDAPSQRRVSRPSRYYRWSELMRRVFQVDVLRCPRCHASPMRILAAIHPPTVTVAILKSLGLPTRAPPITPPRTDGCIWSMGEPRSKWGDQGRPAA